MQKYWIIQQLCKKIVNVEYCTFYYSLQFTVSELSQSTRVLSVFLCNTCYRLIISPGWLWKMIKSVFFANMSNNFLECLYLHTCILMCMKLSTIVQSVLRVNSILLVWAFCNTIVLYYEATRLIHVSLSFIYCIAGHFCAGCNFSYIGGWGRLRQI